MPAVAEVSDEEVRAAVAGDRAALNHVVTLLGPRVRLMVAGRLNGGPQAMQNVEDIAQTVMADLSTSLIRLNKQTWDGLKSFVSSLVAHKVADFLRDPARRASGRVVSLDATITALSSAAPLWECLSSGGTSPSSAAGRAEECAILLRELGELKAEHREVITLAFFDQLPTGQIAERLSISRPAASMLLIRAVESLRRRMRREP